MRQPQDALGKASLRLKIPLWNTDLIREKIVYAMKSRCIRIADPGNLNRSRTICHDRQRIVLRVTGQIDQYVNLVLCNEACGLPRRSPAQITPSYTARTQTLRHGITPARRITEHHELLPIEMVKQGRQKIRDRMFPKVWGYITDAQLFLWRSRRVFMNIWMNILHLIICLCLLTTILSPKIPIIAHKKVLAVEFGRLIRCIRKTTGHEKLVRCPLRLSRKIECISKPSTRAL